MILQQVDIVLDFSINTEDKPRVKLWELFIAYLGVTVIPFKLEPVMLVIFNLYIET